MFWDASPFPTSEYYIINSYMFAPFWSDIDIASTGSVSYEVYIRGDTESQDAILDRVSGFVSTQTSSGFSGYMMMVAQWDAVHPFPHSLGPTGLSDEYIDYLQQVECICVDTYSEHKILAGKHLPGSYYNKWNIVLCRVYLQL